MRALALALVVLLSGCGVPCATIAASRCNGNLVEICGSDLRWRTAMDCDRLPQARVSKPMRCQPSAADKVEATCLPRK